MILMKQVNLYGKKNKEKKLCKNMGVQQILKKINII